MRAYIQYICFLVFKSLVYCDRKLNQSLPLQLQMLYTTVADAIQLQMRLEIEPEFTASVAYPLLT